MDLNFDEIDKTIKSDEAIIDFSSLYNDCLIDLSEEMPRPEIILSIGNYNYKGEYYPNPIMTAASDAKNPRPKVFPIIFGASTNASKNCAAR